VEKVFYPAFVSDEPEPLVYQEPCDSSGRHSPNPSRPQSLSSRWLSWKIRASLGKFSPGSQGQTSL
jgi:hypothetical protein